MAAGILALALLAGCSASSGSGRGAPSSPSATGYDGALLPRDLRPRAFTLINQYGQRVSLSEFRGKVTILAFLDTASKTTAPLIAQQIRGALDELPAGIATLAVSLDPARDTAARVRAFLRAASLAGRMQYLTGATAQLRPVWRAYAARPPHAGALAYERSAFVLLLDREGSPRVEFPLEDLTPEALAHDVRRLERE